MARRMVLALVLLSACDGAEQARSPVTTAKPRATTTTANLAAVSPSTATPDADVASTSSTTVAANVERWARLPNAPVSPGLGMSAVWTGSELVVVGGMPSGKVEEAGMSSTAAAYDPDTNRWRKLPPVPGAGRSLHAALWTGAEMIVWGGRRSTDYGTDGAAYNTTTNRWRTIARSPLSGRENAMAVWTGREMIVWGGNRNWSRLSDGAAYDPTTDSWRPLPAAPIGGRWAATAVWTGTEVLIWGGNGGRPDPQAGARGEAYVTDRGDGAAYNPATNRWRRMAAGPLGPRITRGVRADNQLVIFGGSRDDEENGLPATDGATYNPNSDTWRRLKDPRPPAGAEYHGPQIWTGRELLVGGAHQGRARWIAYQPATDMWRVLPAPPRVDNHGPLAVWTGSEMLLWGAVYNCDPFADCTVSVTGQAGLRYSPPY